MAYRPCKTAAILQINQPCKMQLQMALQGVLAAGQLGHIGLAVTRQVVAVGWGLAPPLAVIRGQAGAAVALPTLAVIG